MDYNISFTDTTKSFVVKPYTANGPNNPAAASPLYSSAVSANTSLVILGKGAFDYGEPIQKNLVHLLENFANKTRPNYPIPGQLWYKTVPVGDTEAGDPYHPTDPIVKGLYIFNGATWSQVLTAETPLSNVLDANNFKVVNVADATLATDALNRRTGDARYVNVVGDTMSGTLNMSSHVISNVGNATAAYDAVSMGFGDGRYIRSAGGQMLGSLDMNNNFITNVKDAVNPQDALNLRTAQSIFVTAGVNGAVDGGTY